MKRPHGAQGGRPQSAIPLLEHDTTVTVHVTHVRPDAYHLKRVTSKRRPKPSISRLHAPLVLLTYVCSSSFLSLRHEICLHFLTFYFFLSPLLTCTCASTLPSYSQFSMAASTVIFLNMYLIMSVSCSKFLSGFPPHSEWNAESPSRPSGPHVLYLLSPTSSLNSLQVIPRRPFCCSVNIPTVFLLQSYTESFFSKIDPWLLP